MDLSLTITAAKQAGFSGANLITAIAIAGAESGYNVNALGDTDITDSKWGPSVGLWQIRSLRNPSLYSYPDSLRDETKLLDPFYNAKAAYAISKAGTNWKPWSTFNNGNYQKYLTSVTNAVQTAAPVAVPILLILVVAYFILK